MTVTDHAVRRYIERVKPTMSLKAARAEVERLLLTAETTTVAPVWAGREEKGDARTFAIIAPGIALPITETGVALTCLTNGTLSGATRSRRNRMKAQERSRRQAKRGNRGARPKE